MAPRPFPCWKLWLPYFLSFWTVQALGSQKMFHPISFFFFDNSQQFHWHIGIITRDYYSVKSYNNKEHTENLILYFLLNLHFWIDNTFKVLKQSKTNMLWKILPPFCLPPLSFSLPEWVTTRNVPHVLPEFLCVCALVHFTCILIYVCIMWNILYMYISIYYIIT